MMVLENYYHALPAGNPKPDFETVRLSIGSKTKEQMPEVMQTLIDAVKKIELYCRNDLEDFKNKTQNRLAPDTAKRLAP